MFTGFLFSAGSTFPFKQFPPPLSFPVLLASKALVPGPGMASFLPTECVQTQPKLSILGLDVPPG